MTITPVHTGREPCLSFFKYNGRGGRIERNAAKSQRGKMDGRSSWNPECFFPGTRAFATKYVAIRAPETKRHDTDPTDSCSLSQYLPVRGIPSLWMPLSNFRQLQTWIQ
nr:hypothetical protein L203_06595 [Cryptococcus depauperatus CBS 7841]